MTGGLSEGEVFELGLQEGIRPWHFQAKVGTQHSSRKKQTASQYLLSLPNLQHVVGNGEKLWGCQTRRLYHSFELVVWRGDRRGRYVRVQGWDMYWLWKCLSSSVSPSLRPSLTRSCSFAVPQSLSALSLAGNTHFCSFAPIPLPGLSHTRLGNERLQ